MANKAETAMGGARQAIRRLIVWHTESLPTGASDGAPHVVDGHSTLICIRSRLRTAYSSPSPRRARFRCAAVIELAAVPIALVVLVVASSRRWRS